jgi:hypothetical protein
MGSSTARVHKEDGLLTLEPGAVLKVGTANVAASVTFTFTAAASTVSECAIAVLDGAGVAVTTPQVIHFWLSDAATGLGLTGTAATTLAVKSACGTDLSVLVAAKADLVQTLATGIYTSNITSSAKTLYYVAAYLPAVGKTFVSRVMVTGDYGA